MNAAEELKLILAIKYDIDADAFVGCLYYDKKIEQMLKILKKHPEVTDSDEVYTILAKVTNASGKPVTEKLKDYMKK